MTQGRRLAAWLVLAAALGFAILGQFYFFYRREYLWDGVVLHVLAAVCFLLAWRLSRPVGPRTAARRPSRLGPWLRVRLVPGALVAVGVSFSLIASLLSRGDRSLDQPTNGAVLFWGLGVAAIGLAALWPAMWPPVWLQRLVQARKGRWREVPRATWLEAATVTALTLLALILRATALDSVPYTLGGDEAWHGLLARQVLAGELRNPFTMGYMSMPTLFYWPLSWSLWLAGDNMVGLRLPAALAGAATVPVLYLFARDLWGRRTALLSSLLLAAYDYHIHYRRLGANNVWDPLFVVLTLWALDRGLVMLQERGGEGEQENGGSRERGGVSFSAYRSFIVAGMVMGLSVYFYTGTRLLPLLMGTYVAFVCLKTRLRGGGQIKGLGLHLVLLVLAFLVVGGPMLSYAQAHPDEWNARINQVGIIQSGWLEREPEMTGKSTAQILGEQFLHSAGAFHIYPDRTAWYGADRPLLGYLAGAFAVLGMAWAIAHWRDRRYFLVLVWFWAVIITGGMLTESPPSSQRLVLTIPVVALLVAFGLEQSVRLVCRLLGVTRGWENLALALLVAILAVSSIRFYFLEYTPSRRYGSENGETATMIAHYLSTLEAGDRVYFFGAPRIYWSFGTIPFLAPQVVGKDVVESLSGLPDFVEQEAGDAGQGLAFLFLPERLGELTWVEQAFPGGQVREFHDANDRLRFTAYLVP